MIGLLCLMVFGMICLQLRLVVLARRISEQLKARTSVSDGLTVKISCDTSEFDAALKIATERAQILSAAFESALAVGVKP